MAKKPEDEFVITDDDVGGLGSKDKNGAEVVEAVIEPTKDGPEFEASESLKDQLDDLKRLQEEDRKRADESERALAAERQGREADRAKASKAETELVDSRLQTIGNALEKNDMSLKDAKSRFAAALTEGDYSKASDVQSEIADFAVKKQRLEEGRNQIELQIERAKETPPPPAVPADPVQAFIDKLPDTQRGWANDHREWFTSQSKNARVVAAHYKAVEDKGFREGSPQYFAHIEQELGLREPEVVAEPERTVERRQAPPAAPVERSAPNSSGARQSNGKIRLPAAYVEAAMISGLTPEQYWAAMTPEERARITN